MLGVCFLTATKVSIISSSFTPQHLYKLLIACEFYKFAFLPHSYQCVFLVCHSNVQCATNVLVQSYVPSFLPYGYQCARLLQVRLVNYLAACLPACCWGCLLRRRSSAPAPLQCGGTPGGRRKPRRRASQQPGRSSSCLRGWVRCMHGNIYSS